MSYISREIKELDLDSGDRVNIEYEATFLYWEKYSEIETLKYFVTTEEGKELDPKALSQSDQDFVKKAVEEDAYDHAWDVERGD